MSNKKQSSLELMWEEIDNLIPFKDSETSQKFCAILDKYKAIHKEEIKNAQMDMYNYVNDLPYGLSYFAQLQKAEDFADNYCNETFGGEND